MIRGLFQANPVRNEDAAQSHAEAQGRRVVFHPRGGLIRRTVAGLDHEIGRDPLCEVVQQRGVHLRQGGWQVIMGGHRAPIRELP
ncbi:hypothetical protein [Salipiger sp.]|uniref:hypothetical protein n=1 Tax=Salipiger sp. TaxID=2078585 RepID=UPI003A975D94